MSQRKEKEAVLHHLTATMNAAGYDVERMTLTEDEMFVEVLYESGYRTSACVDMDSPEALLRDVLRATVMMDSPYENQL